MARALDDTLHAPLLDGRQGKNCISNNAHSSQLPGDVIADQAHTTNREHPHKQDELAQPADQSKPTHQPYRSSTGLYNPNIPEKAVATTNRAQLVDGLLPPTLEATGQLVLGKDIDRLCLQNKQQRHALQEQQDKVTLWKTYTGTTVLPPPTPLPQTWRGEMCPSDIATSHPMGELLNEWSQMGCPTQMGRPWSKEEMWEAVQRGQHNSVMSSVALAHFAEEAREKVKAGQATIVEWDSIKDHPPPELKISPIAAMPHKLRGFRSIRNLSFSLRLMVEAFCRSMTLQ
jgi:hypothetical protein